MLDLIFIPLLLVYFTILTALFVFGVNFLHLTFISWRSRNARPSKVDITEWPPVTVQLPIYNEMYVARRLIDAAASLDYPNDRLHVQVLDDSNDETQRVVDEAAAHWQKQGIDVQVVRRPQRTGYKAGALGHGLEVTLSQYIAIFDADFIPPADFIKRALPVLLAEEHLAFVQTRWGHTNRDHSLLTLLQSLSIDGHFGIEQFGRWKAGYFFNFNGTAGIWRREALIDAGGWQTETLTEDLDVSYRAYLKGWRGAYTGDIESPAELPVSFDAYRRQQHRWARGSLACARKHLPTIWKSDMPWWHKVEGTLHLTGYSIHLLMLSLCFLYPLLLLEASRYPQLLSLFGFMAAFNIAGLAPMSLFLTAQKKLGRSWWRSLPPVLMLSLLGAGMMLTTARAAWQAFSSPPGAFERTPKFGVTGSRREWMRLRYQPRVDPIVVAELLLAAFTLGTSYYATVQHAWAVAIYTAVFGSGLLFTAGCTLAQGMGRWLRTHRRPDEPIEATPLPSSVGAD
jgi:cellulose synthase/poly-beta-1,6-N-acetylglucosamine synthase-like glycosyltransferase